MLALPTEARELGSHQTWDFEVPTLWARTELEICAEEGKCTFWSSLDQAYHLYIKKKKGKSKNRTQIMITIILNEYLSSGIINVSQLNSISFAAM